MLRSTTKAQVSGHRFLQRRLEHGLVLGDCRMISDPLGRRARAGLFGAIGAGVVGLLSVGLAVFAPAPHPGDALVIVDNESQQLYVQLAGTYHPVSNVTSARLIVGQPVDPAPADPRFVRQVTKGPPMGLRDVPPSPGSGTRGADLAASVCMNSDGSAVVLRLAPAGEQAPMVGTAVLAAGDSEYLLTHQGRALLPAATDPEGVALRRGLGITASTPRWELSPHAIEVFPELNPIAVPESIEEILLAPGGKGWGYGAEGLVPLTDGQVTALKEVLPTRDIAVQELSRLRDAAYVATVPLPESTGPWLDHDAGMVCAGTTTNVFTAPVDPAAALPVVGAATATHLDAPGDVAVDSGAGIHVIGARGVRHPIPHLEDVAALGVVDPVVVPWRMLRLLPAGQELSHGEAVRMWAPGE